MANLLMQLAVNGVISGSVYVLLGVSWSIIYGTTGTFHFAHAFVIVAAAYAAVLVTMGAGLPLAIGFVAAIIAGVLCGCGIELGIYRPLRKLGAGPFVIFVASLGVLILGQNVMQLIFSSNLRRLEGFPEMIIQIGPVSFSLLHVFMLVLSAVVMCGLRGYLTRTTSGKGIRAVASNAEMAKTVGINTDRTFLLVFAIGSGIAALAAVLITLEGAASPAMGTEPATVAFIVTFLGGIGSLAGAVAGGAILGLSENLACAFIAPTYKMVISFFILLVTIILRPRGLFGLKT